MQRRGRYKSREIRYALEMSKRKNRKTKKQSIFSFPPLQTTLLKILWSAKPTSDAEMATVIK